jgi:hypothetical protein
VRGFKVVRPGSGGYLLQEVLDKGVLSASWKRFRQAALLRVSVEKDMCVPEAYGQALWGGDDRVWPVGLDPASSGGAGLLTSCFTVLPRDDRATGGIRVSVPVFSLLLSYAAVSKTTGCGNEFGWGRFTNEGRIIFQVGVASEIIFCMALAYTWTMFLDHGSPYLHIVLLLLDHAYVNRTGVTCMLPTSTCPQVCQQRTCTWKGLGIVSRYVRRLYLIYYTFQK